MNLQVTQVPEAVELLPNTVAEILPSEPKTSEGHEIVEVIRNYTMPKTLQFKLDLPRWATDKLEYWMANCRLVWNQGLSLYIEHDMFTGSTYTVLEDEPEIDDKGRRKWKPKIFTNEKGKEHTEKLKAPCCPLPSTYILLDKKGEWTPDNLRLIQLIKDRDKNRFYCPVTQKPDYPEGGPKLGLKPLNEYTLQYWFTQKRHPDWVELQNTPSWFVRGALGSLWTAWNHYKKGTYKKPKFKSWRDVTATLLHNNTVDLKVNFPIQPAPGPTVEGQPRDGLFYLPNARFMGQFRVKYLWARWGNLPINMVKICKKPDGWYCQLTSTQYPAKYLSPKNNKVALAIPQKLGLLAIAVDDKGNRKDWKAVPVDAALERRIVKLQQSMSRQETVVKLMRKYFNDVLIQLRHCLKYLLKFDPQLNSITELLFVYTLTRLQHKHAGINLKKTKKKLARIHNLIATRRKSHNEKIASILAQQYGTVIVQEVRVGAIAKPEPKIRPGTFPVHYDPNGASQVASVNKVRSNIAAGQFIAALERKCKEYGREFIKQKSRLSSKIIRGFTSPNDFAKIASNILIDVSSEVPSGEAKPKGKAREQRNTKQGRGKAKSRT